MKGLRICAILAIFICSGYAQIDATDVIHQVDGTDSVGRLTAFDGVIFTVDIQGELSQIPPYRSSKHCSRATSAPS